jgi:hypothetical protein
MQRGRGRLPPARSVLLGAALLAGLFATGGCAGDGLRPLRRFESETEARLTEEELAERLDRFAELYAQSILEGVRAITETEKDPAHQRAALVWQIQSIRTCRNAVLATDPQVAFTDVWALCVQQRQYLESAAFANRAGEHADRLVAAARRIETEIETIGAGFLKPEELARAKADVAAFAKQYPIQEGFARAAPLPSAAPSSAASRLSWVTSIPMAPFRFVAGIDEGAAAIRHFSAVAERFSRRVDALPQETLWEAQLLLLDLEQRPAIQKTVASIESAAETGTSLAASADRFARTAENLPAEVRKEVDAAFAALESRQSELRATIDEVRKALADARDVAEKADVVVRDAKTTGEGFEGTAKAVGEASRSLEAAVQAYKEMMQTVHPRDAAEAPPGPDEKPFDVLDWKKTAESVGAAAAELRGALVEFQRTAKDEAVVERASAAARAAREQAEEAIDHAFVRALQLVGVIAAVFVLLRFLPGRRRGTDATS